MKADYLTPNTRPQCRNEGYLCMCICPFDHLPPLVQQYGCW